jgi:tRNA 2-thiouridine synthesizing protein C
MTTLPYASWQAQEGFEMFLTAASFDFTVALLFLGDGVWQLRSQQSSDTLERKNIAKMFSLLQWIEAEVYIEAKALKERDLSLEDCAITGKCLAAEEIKRLNNRFNHHLRF